jgi:hypothetical protein
MASRRGYVTQAEVEQYANITITDSAEGDDQISQAEELIDAYVGFQRKAFIGFGLQNGTGVFTPPDYADLPQQDQALYGMASNVTVDGQGNHVITLQTYQENVYQANYFTFCTFEIIGGPGAGQRLQILSSTLGGVITINGAFDPAPDTTSLYKIYQLGKFPRERDVFYNTYENPPKYYKSIPEAVKRAVCAQIEYMITQGTSYFAGDGSHLQSEHIGDYSYTRMTGAVENLIAPKAQMYLRGLRNMKGNIVI